ncbi:MAG: APC family permease [Gammaproteobacteria bacterium]|nr:APC family permease [Gammaproteobacteria bacterium]
MPEESPDNHLKRTLGLPATLSVGVGTMLGAGIFVFPGLAANEAGPAAILSFAIGGGIALLVALCTAELATAMPRSGGAYFHVSRSFGEFAGLLVGVAQSTGLVFASAFYLVAFADYALDLIAATPLSIAEVSSAFAVSAALLLTLVNIVGSGESGRLQSVIVLLLAALLIFLFGAGLLRAAGITGEASGLPEFAPFGVMPIFSTAAFVFTSYLGFVQISTVAGEVRNPGRTLPVALIGSVILVAVLYVVALFVTTSLLSAERLAETGSTTTIELGKHLFGEFGKMLVLLAGLLATLSSANASILSSSRTLYALGHDRLAPAWTATVSARFRTPYFAILLVGVAVATLTLLGDLKTLAEVASALHLLIYALICGALLRQRSQSPDEYTPTFRVPAARLVAVSGAACCLGLLAFMEPIALAIGAGVLVAAVAWYMRYRNVG